METKNCRAGIAAAEKPAPEIMAFVEALARQLAREDNEAVSVTDAGNGSPP